MNMKRTVKPDDFRVPAGEEGAGIPFEFVIIGQGAGNRVHLGYTHVLPRHESQSGPDDQSTRG